MTTPDPASVSVHEALVLGTGCGNDVSLMRALLRAGWTVWFGGAEAGIGQRVRGVAGHVPLRGAAVQDLVALREWAAHRPGRPVLIPTNDATVMLAWKHLEELAESFVVPTVPSEALPELFFKERLQAACKRLGIRHPETVLELGPGEPLPEQAPRLPLLAKPVAPKEPMLRDQKTKVVLVQDAGDWADFVARRLDTIAVLFTDYVPHHRKALCAAFVDRNGALAFRNSFLVDLIHPPRDGNAVLCSPYDAPELAHGLELLARETGYQGFMELEFIEHEGTGEWYAIDVQCRPTLQNAGLIGNGLDFDAALRHLLDGTPYPTGGATTKPRGWVDLVRLLRAVRSSDSPWSGRWFGWAGRLLAVLTGRVTDATFSWRDPGAFLADLRWSLRS